MRTTLYVLLQDDNSTVELSAVGGWSPSAELIGAAKALINEGGGLKAVVLRLEEAGFDVVY